MTDDELRTELAEGVRVELEGLRDFARAVTVTLGLFPLFYGLLILVFGVRLWDVTGVHSGAMKVPGAPETWGVAFVLLGAGIVVTGFFDRRFDRWWPTGFNAAAGAFSALFMSSFLLNGILPRGLTSVVIYGVFAVLFIHSARRAWVA